MSNNLYCIRIRAALLATLALIGSDIHHVRAQGISSDDVLEGATAARRTCGLGQIRATGKCHRANRKICGDKLAQIASGGVIQTFREATARCGNGRLIDDRGICRSLHANEEKTLAEKCANLRF